VIKVKALRKQALSYEGRSTWQRWVRTVGTSRTDTERIAVATRISPIPINTCVFL